MPLPSRPGGNLSHLPPSQGVEGIRKVFLREAKNTEYMPGRGFVTDNEWVLDTEGTNLLAVMCHPEVDYARTTSNHIIDMIDVLGIEAARNSLLKVGRIGCSRGGGSVAMRRCGGVLLAHRRRAYWTVTQGVIIKR